MKWADTLDTGREIIDRSFFGVNCKHNECSIASVFETGVFWAYMSCCGESIGRPSYIEYKFDDFDYSLRNKLKIKAMVASGKKGLSI